MCRLLKVSRSHVRIFVGVLALGLAFSSPARAQGAPSSFEPLITPPKTGLVSVLAGVRYVPQAPLLSSALKAGWISTERALVTPAVAVPFGYRVDGQWSVFVEFDWAQDSYGFRNESAGEGASANAQVTVQTFALLIGGQRAFDFGWERVEPYVGFGAGYYLSTLRVSGALGELPNEFEAHTGGGYLSAGLRIGLGGGWSAVVEERYAFAVPGLADFGTVNVGGNTVSVGLGRVWR